MSTGVNRMRRWKCHLRAGLRAVQSGTVRGLAAFALGGLCLSTSLADDAVFSSKARFRIPYQLDAEEIQRLRAAEIQLHVSTDRGLKWRHVDSVPPVEGKFTFEAAQDGEYWFSVRTVGEDGRQHPSGPMAAGLKVDVDTVPPTISLDLSETDMGQVGLRWEASDKHLDLESLVLEYSTDGQADWSAIQVVPTEAGETNWSVPEGGTVSVRGRILDRAGNQATQAVQVVITPVAVPQMPAAPAVRRPIAAGGPAAAPQMTTDPLAEAASPPRPGIPQTDAGLPAINPNGGDYSRFVSQRNALDATTPQSSVAAPLTQTMSPPPRHAPHVRRVNSTNFQIGYAIDDVGPSGVSSVDLYVTEDQGRKWYHYGIDSDGQSPFDVTVPQDGHYGFAIRVRSGVGLAQTPPQPGQAPEVMVSVDRQPPQATLLPLKQGHGQLPSQLLIEWTLDDEQLSDRPVSLYYAPRSSGPWLPITGWEPNTGQYLWAIGPDAPKQVYIRLEARDAAGNIARVETAEPMLIDLSRPTARIIDVESASPRY